MNSQNPSADLFMIYGGDGAAMTSRLLQAVGLADLVSGKKRVGIKPNLVLPSPAEQGATTHPQIVSAIVHELRRVGCPEPVILESAWVGARTSDAFEVCGYRQLAQDLGIQLWDLEQDRGRKVKVAGEQIQVCERALELDFLINVPVLKAHCQTRLTCALKNMKGCLPDGEKRRFHTLGLHRPIALLNKVLKSDLTIVDGLCGDLTFEEGGNPVPTRRMVAGRDPVLVDALAAELLGYSVEQIEYIGLAQELGVGTADLSRAQVHELNDPQDQDGDVPLPDPEKLSAGVQRLARLIDSDQACSACYGGLLHALRRLSDEGLLDRLPAEALALGQGYAEQTGGGFGVGDCTCGLDHHLPGCPPRAADMVAFLKGLLS